MQGEFKQANKALEESLALFWNTGDKTDLAEGLEGLASVAGVRQQSERAARLWGAAESLRIRLKWLHRLIQFSRFFLIKDQKCLYPMKT